MNRRRRLAFLGLCLLALAAAPSGPVAAREDGPSVGTPAEGQLYHGVYPGGRTGWEDGITPADLTAYEDAAGAEAAWRVGGFSWWNETWQNDGNPAHDTDMRIQTVPDLSEVFQGHLASNPSVLTQPLP